MESRADHILTVETCCPRRTATLDGPPRALMSERVSMVPLYSRSVMFGNLFHTWREVLHPDAQSHVMEKASDTGLQIEMGARLRAIREVLDLTQAGLGEIMGIGATTIASWESGRNQIDIVKLSRAAKHCGFSTDWVALGDFSGLRFDLATKLQAYMRAQIANTGPARRGRPSKTQPPPNSEAPLVREAKDPTHKGSTSLNEQATHYIPPAKFHAA